ncbi:uncharacterized protein [Drosophila virilis]|uniref:DUF4771 domain-containing protein n=1 Tax=Drosophila virilis TaxID=7244 RepID=B4LPL4_DROVI|nr:uncharacterized protein LOC6625332 [Drosophila virilis]EDW60252.1 uncharacterized protein Dvir_GJ21377 [Drosophila virilis]
MGLRDFQKKLDQFQKAVDVPKWYLGLSDYQEDTIKELCNDLRDDFEQGTSFRVEKSLTRLGLSPLISKKKIRTMVQLSRGNDLAFIFFILEGYYISCRKNGEYTTNEKLLMIAMAKIDLLPTLQELDRILPPPQLSELDLKRQRRSYGQQQRTSKFPLEQQTRKKKSKSTQFPYFQRQPRPKEIVVKYTSKPPNVISNFPFWPLDQPPNYGIKSDPPWFAEYNLNPVGRLVKSTVAEAVDKYFHHLNHIKYLESRARFSRRAAAALEKAMDDDDTEPLMCAYHKFAIGEAQLIKDELVVMARDRCIELMDVTLPYRKLRQKRIVAQLERDIDDCIKRYSMKMESTTVHTISKSDCVLCQEQRVDFPVAKPQERKGRALVGDNLHLAHTQATDTCIGARLCGGGLRREPIDFEVELPPCRSSNAGTSMLSDASSCVTPKGKSQQRISFLLDDSKLKKLRKNRKDQTVEVRYQGKQTKKTFFTAPSDHKPYQFKYKRIFKSGQEKPRDVKKVIAKAFVSALDRGDGTPIPLCEKPAENTSEDDVEKLEMEVSGIRLTDSCASTDDTSEHSKRSYEDRRADIVDAVVRCAKEIWMKGVNAKRAEMEMQESEAKAKENPMQSSILTYDIEKFDPDNAQLMNRMLQDGLAQLRKNQRFVLASLPDAYKLPVLQAWIRRRYGKQYNEEEAQKSIQQSIKVFETITLLQGMPPPADLMGMDHMPQSKENFAYCKQAKALAAKVRQEYYKKLNDIYMNHTIACWYAMGNYMCRAGPPRKTFYAYMSANTRDIMRNKVWNGEYRDIRQFRDNYKETHKK